MLDFARLESGRFELEQANFDLHDLIQGVGSVLQTRAAEKGLTGGIDIGANCPRFIVGDAARLRQVLLSLVDNALKFTAHGSVRLHASAQELDDRPVLRCDVTDTGVGLSKAVQERLFQIESRIAGQTIGTGLGPSIARKLATLMGGEVGCESVVGQGTLYGSPFRPNPRACPRRCRSRTRSRSSRGRSKAMSWWSRTMPSIA